MDKVEFYRHSLTEEDIAAVGEVLRSVFLTTGPRTAAFESALAEFTGLKRVVGLSSCTTALFLGLKATGIGGVVTLDAQIGTDGSVRDLKVLTSSNAELESAAIDAVRRWEFTPTYLNCTPVEVRMQVTVNFVVKP